MIDVMSGWWQALGCILFVCIIGIMIFNIMFEIEAVEVD